MKDTFPFITPSRWFPLLTRIFVNGFLFLAIFIGLPSLTWAASESHAAIDLTTSPVGFFALGLFILAYALVMSEEFTHLRKSKPVILAAGIIWAAISLASPHDQAEIVEAAFRHNLLEYAELMLFLLVAMTYINAMDERLVFESLRAWLVRKGFTYRQLFWITGTLAFLISPVADNLTTALLMCAVVLAVGADNPKFVSLSCINIVVAANAGGAFSPFGDITTLMVWQKGILQFFNFFLLFIPSLVNYLVPALIMLGMMTGLAYLQFFGYYLKKQAHAHHKASHAIKGNNNTEELGDVIAFDIFQKIARAEWDTLLFFYGVVVCVGGLGFIGYLSMASEIMYSQWGPTFANTMVGVLSAIVDNIPVMFAVLTMNPEMAEGQWLLVTLTAGVGGSLLSIGSAAGVALMGQAKGKYTFFSHLKWTPAIALGYAASILVHMWINASTF